MDSLKNSGEFTKISIHALREERDCVQVAAGPRRGISIHALREERDSIREKSGAVLTIFQSTRSARSATGCPASMCRSALNFNPRAPRGARRADVSASAEGIKISIHALREERDFLSYKYSFTSFPFQSTRSARSATAYSIGDKS